MRTLLSRLPLLALLATPIACAPVSPAPPATIAVRITSADSTAPVRFAAWAANGVIDVRSPGAELSGTRVRLETSTPADVMLGEGVTWATFVSLGDSPALQFEALAPEGTVTAEGHRVYFERNAWRMGVRVRDWRWPWE